MKTLKEKLKKIPSPIREMILENDDREFDINKQTNILLLFVWEEAKHLPDHEFWSLVYMEIELL